MYNTSDKGHLRRWQGAHRNSFERCFKTLMYLVKFGHSITGWYKLRDRLGPDGQVYSKSTNRFVARARVCVANPLQCLIYPTCVSAARVVPRECRVRCWEGGHTVPVPQQLCDPGLTQDHLRLLPDRRQRHRRRAAFFPFVVEGIEPVALNMLNWSTAPRTQSPTPYLTLDSLCGLYSTDLGEEGSLCVDSQLRGIAGLNHQTRLMLVFFFLQWFTEEN